MGEVTMYMQYSEELGFPNPLLERRLMHLEDRIGKHEPVIQLHRMREKGNYDKLVQYNTARNFRVD